MKRSRPDSAANRRRPSGRHCHRKHVEDGVKKTEETQSEGNAVLRGRYELGRVLGHGTFAKVHLAKNLRTDQNVAMKIMAKEKVIQVGMTEQIKREISIMKMVTHPNIVELHEVMATKSKIYFAMELVRGGELFAKIARAGRLREESARKYFRQLISAVDFCHSRGVYHRDLKPENLLLDENGNLKIADFGLSAFADHVRNDGLLHTACGTPAYVAPEVIGNRGYDGAKADVWSCGVILFVLLAGFLPFQADNAVSLCKKIQRGDFKCPPWFSSDARRVVMKLLDPNPSTRMTIERLLNSSWFKRSSASRSLSSAPEQPVTRKDTEEEEPELMNAFHLISLSEGFDLSPLFIKKKEGMRFATREPASSVVARLEEAAEKAEGRFRVTKRSAAGVRLEGEGKGRKGKLAVAAEMFSVGSEVLVVEVKKEGGDTVEYRRFCSDELRPALKDIVWGSAAALAS